MSLFDFFRHGGATDKLIRTAACHHGTSFPLDMLSEVLVLTIDEGQFMNAAFCLRIGADEKSGCGFLHSAEGFYERRAKQLPGFDTEVVSIEKGSTSSARFVCWKPSDSCRR